jgi:hypothetical protein
VKLFRNEQKARCEWLRLFEEPGELGPFAPEEGFELLVAEKREELSAAGDGIDVHFQVSLYAWHGNRWYPLSDNQEERASERGRPTPANAAVLAQRRREAGGGDDWWLIWPRLPRDAAGNVIAAHGSPVQVSPEEPLFAGLRTVWPGDSEIGVLASAWFDYRQQVYEANRNAWETRQSRERERAELGARAALVAERNREAVISQRGISTCLPGPSIDGPSLARIV